MELRSLTLTNFKNIGEASLDFSPKINCFLGDNGMGKSNLLDAIHYLSFCRSFASVADTMVIRRGEDFAMARGIYRKRRGADEELRSWACSADAARASSAQARNTPAWPTISGRFR